jgi:hypothetical protein
VPVYPLYDIWFVVQLTALVAALTRKIVLLPPLTGHHVASTKFGMAATQFVKVTPASLFSLLVHFVSTYPQQVFKSYIHHFVNEERKPLQAIEGGF